MAANKINLKARAEEIARQLKEAEEAQRRYEESISSALNAHIEARSETVGKAVAKAVSTAEGGDVKAVVKAAAKEALAGAEQEDSAARNRIEVVELLYQELDIAEHKSDRVKDGKVVGQVSTDRKEAKRTQDLIEKLNEVIGVYKAGAKPEPAKVPQQV